MRWGRVLRDVFAEVFLRNFGVGAVGLDGGEGFVDGGEQLGLALGQQHAGEIGVGGGGDDLHVGVGLLLLEVEEGEAVVDGGVGAALDDEGDRLIETFGADEFSAIFG